MAAANTVEVRRPIVVVPGELVDSISYGATLPISSFLEGSPSIKYSSHKAGADRVESPTASEIIQRIAEAQASMFQPAASKTVQIIDGAKNVALFTGYDTGPHHDIMFGGVNTGRNIVHRCARLFFINTSIYRPPPTREDQPKTKVAESFKLLEAAKNPCNALKIVLEKLIKDFNKLAGASANTTDAAIRKKIHADNEKILKEEWYPILDASTESGIPDFDSLVKINALRMKMYGEIESVYLGGTADFSVIISQFESMFQMRFIPGHMGTTPGKFIPMADLLSNPVEKEVNIVSMSMNPGPKKFLSPTAVAVRGAPPKDPPVAQATQNAGTDMVTWPIALPAAGQTVVLQMPAWLPSELFPTSIPKTGKSLDFDANFNAVKEAQKTITNSTAIVQKICQDIARLTYVNISLGDAFVSITCPLDVTWELGKRYTVKQPSAISGQSSVLFSGFLRAVNHRVNSSPSKAEASTQLTFSHVEANGFTLPNK